MRLLHRIRNWRNPHNRTDIHLAALIRRYGYAVGEYSYGRPQVRFAAPGRMLTIGRYCSIADRVEILLGDNHRLDWVSAYPFTSFPELWPSARGIEGHRATRGDVTIGHDVWLGSGCTILSGVAIGSGAVVGARAVVARDVPPYGVAVGNPARVVRTRFPDDVVAGLLDAAWWDMPRNDVERLIPLIQSDRVAELLSAIAAARRAGAATT